jgi:predicted phage-related endonuclease
MFSQEHLSESKKMSRDRKTYIGGSDIGSIIGCEGAYSTPLKIWELKTGRVPAIEATFVMKMGNATESLILDEYAEKTGLVFDRQVPMEDPGCDFFAGVADGLGDGFGVDAKFTSKYKFDDGQIPQTWQAQGQWYMMLAGVSVWDFAVVHSAFPQEVRTYRLHRDDEAIAYLRESAQRFWMDVRIDVPPKPAVVCEVARYFKYANVVEKSKVVADERMIQLVDSISTAKTIAKEAKQKEDEYRKELELLMDNASLLVDFDGNKLARWGIDARGIGRLTLY